MVTAERLKNYEQQFSANAIGRGVNLKAMMQLPPYLPSESLQLYWSSSALAMMSASCELYCAC